MSEEGTITPEVQISQLEDALATETDRLKKLFAAYETQEKELVDARAEIEVLEKEIIDKEIEREAQESLIAEKDFRIRELEMKATKADKRVEHLEPALQTMEEKYSREKDRLGKVFGIAEELDNDLKLAVIEMKARDDWYVDHMTLFEDLNKAIKERYEMIERAVEAERESQHMSRAFTERMDEMVEARAAEMTVEEAETVIVEGTGDAPDATEEAPTEEESEEATPEAEAEEAPTEESSEEVAEEETEAVPDETWNSDVDPWADN
tara:strand:- start:43 stop:840 length:798 start_codon:yes stop_codon:yes gene_type:complete